MDRRARPRPQLRPRLTESPFRRIPRPLLRSLAVCAAVAGCAFSVALARTAEEALAEGDQSYAAARLEDARRAYAEAVQASSGNVNALCRLSRTESELGELQKGDEQRRTWADAVSHARDAVRVAGESAEPHVWLAVALGRQALREGPRAKLALSKEIKSETDLALARDPANGRAWHVLAVWNSKIAGLSAFDRVVANSVLGGVPKGASYANAAQAFEKAIALEPQYVNHHVEYGRLLREMGRKADARRELEKAIALPPTSSALDARYQDAARALLEKLGR
jgi:tetratricopeptide (TPR) repeat protein